MSGPWIGQNMPRTDGRGKVDGTASYVDDIVVPGMLFGATVRSPVPRGVIKDIHFEGAVPWDEIIVATASDIPGHNVVKLIDVDQPLLADGAVNHREEPVVLLAHRDRAVVERARRCVRIEVEPLPSVDSIAQALRGSPVVWGTDNVFTEYRVDRGDLEEAWARADAIVEGQYATGAQEQMYIEPQGMLAVVDPGRAVEIFGSLQCPYYIQAALSPVFGLDASDVRVVQTVTGGGFGGKEEYPSMIAGHAALLAHKAGKPVKLIYDRVEDVRATTKRHPSQTLIRAAVTRDGVLLGLEIDFVIDGGAYKTLSPVVLSRGTIHAAGPYRCHNVRIRSRAVATNTPPHGAFRGFGAPQSIFALEKHLDRVASALEIDPVVVRQRNLLSTGDSTAVGQVIREPIDLQELVDTALADADYFSKRKAFAEHNAASDPVKRGVGVSVFFHGAGFTGSGETHLASVVDAEATADGRLRILAASTEIGQGTKTIFAQIAADAAGIEPGMVDVAQPDTAAVPDSGPTVASRTCMVVGALVARACVGLVTKLRDAGVLGDDHTASEFADACSRYCSAHGPLRSSAQYEVPKDVHWDEEAFRGDAYSRYAWAAYVATVAVDTRTFEVQVEDFVAVQEAGTIINPVLAGGQIEGGVTQGIGHALYEKVVYQDGGVANPQMTNYIIPTSVDTPPIRVRFVAPFEGAGAAAKGIGELPMDGPAPAVIAAVEHATGVKIDAIPMLPEDLRDAVEGSSP